MTARDIVLWPDAGLAAVCDDVYGARPSDLTPDDRGVLDRLIADLFDTMYAAPGRGLAAPQIGVARRVFVTDTTWKDGTASPMVFVDPRIVESSSGTATRDEGCLSIPGRTVWVTRPAGVRVAWRGADGTSRSEAFDGFAAACVQHEIDHLDGILTLDRAAGGTG